MNAVCGALELLVYVAEISVFPPLVDVVGVPTIPMHPVPWLVHEPEVGATVRLGGVSRAGKPTATPPVLATVSTRSTGYVPAAEPAGTLKVVVAAPRALGATTLATVPL